MVDFAIVVPWVTDTERRAFLEAWGMAGAIPDWLILQQDVSRAGCGPTKNLGIDRAMTLGAEIVVILDGDCYPEKEGGDLSSFVEAHRAALEPQPVELFQAVTSPPSRGTPYMERSITLPVAASMGFWTEVGDHCAVRQLAFGAAPMEHRRKSVFWCYFPLCGMNLAFRPQEWLPWCRFIDVARFDDIWMGWLWQREAYRRGYCFNLAGPLVRHARQSNVWRNLEAEAMHLEASETLWRKIATWPAGDYESLRKLLPC